MQGGSIEDHKNKCFFYQFKLNLFVCCRFWGIKYMIVTAMVIGAFFIPDGNFSKIWMYFGIIGAFIFIIVQLILIVDFAHSWAENWVSKYEQTESKKWLVV